MSQPIILMKRPKSLQEAIHVYPGTVFLVSHEADFYEEIVDRVIDIEELVNKEERTKLRGVNLVLSSLLFIYSLSHHGFLLNSSSSCCSTYRLLFLLWQESL